MVNSPLFGFQQPRRGLFTPSPGGLVGFQRQGMDQRKKASARWADYDPYRDMITPGPNGYNAALWDGAVMRWVNSAFDTTLGEHIAAGPMWAMHTRSSPEFPNGGAYPNERGSASVDSIPLTNAVSDAYIHIIWPSARAAKEWRGHNLNGDWGAARVPGSTRLDAWNGSSWITLDNGPAILNGTGDTGYRQISTPVLATQHRLFLGNNAGNTAQSLCFLDIVFIGGARLT